MQPRRSLGAQGAAKCSPIRAHHLGSDVGSWVRLSLFRVMAAVVKGFRFKLKGFRVCVSGCVEAQEFPTLHPLRIIPDLWC